MKLFLALICIVMICTLITQVDAQEKKADPTISIQTDKYRYYEVDVIHIIGQLDSSILNATDGTTVSMWANAYEQDNGYSWVMIEIVEIPLINNTFSYDIVTDGSQWRNYTSGTVLIEAQYQNQTGRENFYYSDYPSYLSTYFLHDMYLIMTLQILDLTSRIADLENNQTPELEITICHVPPTIPQTIIISESEWYSHELHGDYLGECIVSPELNETLFCDERDNKIKGKQDNNCEIKEY